MPPGTFPTRAQPSASPGPSPHGPEHLRARSARQPRSSPRGRGGSSASVGRPAPPAPVARLPFPLLPRRSHRRRGRSREPWRPRQSVRRPSRPGHPPPRRLRCPHRRATPSLEAESAPDPRGAGTVRQSASQSRPVPSFRPRRPQRDWRAQAPPLPRDRHNPRPPSAARRSRRGRRDATARLPTARPVRAPPRAPLPQLGVPAAPPSPPRRAFSAPPPIPRGSAAAAGRP